MRSGLMAVLFGFVVGLALGCGSKPTEVLGDGGGGADSAPKPVAPAELPAAEAKLADLEKKARAKEKELSDLRAEADALRKRIAVSKTNDKVYTKGEDLLAEMPKDVYPKFDDGIAQAKARKWVKANLVGRTVEAEYTVGSVVVTGDDPYTVLLILNDKEMTGRFGPMSGRPLGSLFALGGQNCRVYAGWGGFAGPRRHAAAMESDTVVYHGCTEAEATKLKGFSDRKVRLRATITGVELSDTGAYLPLDSDFRPQKNEDAVPIGLLCTTPSIDGFLPHASKPKIEKK